MTLSPAARRALLAMRPGEWCHPEYAQLGDWHALVTERPDLCTLDAFQGHRLTAEGERVREVISAN